MHPSTGLPRVFLFEDVCFFRTPLSAIAAEARCETILREETQSLGTALEGAGPPLQLLILPLQPYPDRMLAALREARDRTWLHGIPVLAVSALDRSDLDLWQLRALGVVGLIDKRSLPEHVRFRISQSVYAGREGRRYERAPCCIPVDVDANGVVTTEYAVSLSVGGMGLACNRPLEPNTEVHLRFSVPSRPQGLLEIDGRVIHARSVRRPDATQEVGLFFHQIDESTRSTIAAEVGRLLVDADQGLLGAGLVSQPLGVDSPGTSP